MDGFIDIIIIGGVIVLIVVRIIDFLRKLSARFSAQIEQAANTTPKPDIEQRSEPYEKQEKTRTIVAPELTYELKIARENKSRQKAKQTAEKNSTSSANKAASKIVANEAKSDINNENAEFDLRQAIIYSEIMKPKYNDEDI